MRKVFLAAIAVFAAYTLTAQEQRQRVTLTLEEAVDIALSENPTIKIADMEIERQDYMRKETIGNLLPSLSGTGQYNYAIQKQTMSRDGVSFGADNTVTLGANLNVPLFVPAVYASLKMNKAQMESAIESARSSKINMVNEVKKAYYNTLLLNESLRVLRESEKLAQETVDNTRLMYESELSSEYDYISAEVALNNIKPNIIQVEGSIEVSMIYIHMLLSLPQDVDVVLTGSLDSYSGAIMSGTGQYSTDISGNSELRALNIQSKLLEGQLKITNAQRIPTIAAFGQLSLYGNDMGSFNFGGSGAGAPMTFDPSRYPTIAPYIGMLGQQGINELQGLLGEMMMGGGTAAPAAKGMWWQVPSSVGLSISIPIFSGNKINNQVKQTKVAMSQLQLQKDYLEQSTTMQVKTAISNLMTARGKMTANQKSVTQAKKAYEITNVRYNGGAGTILELNTSQMQLTQAQLNYTQAVYDYLAAQADYEKVIGKDF